jgi:hypothetical protein
VSTRCAGRQCKSVNLVMLEESNPKENWSSRHTSRLLHMFLFVAVDLSWGGGKQHSFENVELVANTKSEFLRMRKVHNIAGEMALN